MNSEAAKNPVLDVRKELEAQASLFEGRARSNLQHPSAPARTEVYLECAEQLRALLQRIPEGWEMRPKDPNQAMLRVVPPGTGAYWRAMWDAAKAEAGDE